jgi:cytochrome P450
MTSQSCPFVIDPSGQDIHGEAAKLRALGRVAKVELPGKVLAWWITDHALIKQLLTDSRVSRDTYQHWPAWGNGESQLAKTWPLAIWVADRNMITAYGAEHARLRKLVAKAFTARQTAAMRPRIESITVELLDRLAEHGPRKTVDLRAEFAYPLPVQVISELLGVPDGIRDKLLDAVHVIMQTTASVEEANANENRLYGLLGELMAIKRDQPGDDLTTGLIHVADDGAEGLSERELVDTVLLMFTAGHETTVNLFDQAIYAILMHPGLGEMVRRGEANWEDVIEETLRLEAPFANLPMRYAVEDIELDELTIAKGDPIVIAFGAVGRDPLLHGETADQFNFTRPTLREHLAFGYGVHHCPDSARDVG